MTARRPPHQPSSVPDREAEEQAHAAGYARVCGIDEAGRGPLAGPVADEFGCGEALEKAQRGEARASLRGSDGR